MDAIDLLRQQTKAAWDWLESILAGVDEEQANWQPGGTANSISAGYAHLLLMADAGFNTQLKGQMPIIATEFKGQVGLSEPFDASGGWRDWSIVRSDWEMLRTYGRAVHQEVFRHVDRNDAQRPGAPGGYDTIRTRSMEGTRYLDAARDQPPAVARRRDLLSQGSAGCEGVQPGLSRVSLSAPNKTAAQVGEKAGWLRAMGSSPRSA